MSFDLPRANEPLLPPVLAHVAIIGGGITGLSAAFYLEQFARAAGANVQYTLIEREPRLGGKIRTDALSEPGTFIVEGGPDSFVTQKPWGLELVKDLGLEDQVMGTNEARHRVYVLVNGKLRTMPDGMLLIVPSDLWGFARSPLLSVRGKLRMALDLVLPPRWDDADETLASFIRRRLGAEALDRLAEPLLSGIHSAAAERQSILATFPRFRALEAQYGSLIRGMLAAQRAARERRGKDAPSAPPFVTLRNGIGTLVDTLAARLSGRLLTGCGVRALAYAPDADQPYQLFFDTGEALSAHAVILTAPAFVAADLVAPFRPELAAELRHIRYVSTATITLAYRRSDVGEPLDGFGLLIPQSEQRRINACTMSSIKFAQRAPEEYTLVRVFVGGSRNPDMVDLDDAALLALVRDELRDILGIAVAPVFSRIYRWPDANPQYDVGHLDRMKLIDSLCPEGLFLAGSAYHGVGIPDCVRQGREAAARLRALAQQPVQIW